ncbi:MAG TPA: hypothetical protein PLL69_06215 [Gemmatimonadales bacterium]|nr:hypothetical protein [Gemmatimonadales bacterium]
MRAATSLRAALALAWYLGVGFGLPLADGLLFHETAAPSAAHIESTDSDCHRGECSLLAPGAPHSPAGTPADLARLDALPLVALAVPVPADAGTAPPSHFRTARAPPTSQA